MIDHPSNSKLSHLFLLSVFSLFIELVLIRWIGTEVRIFAYLQNTILVVCFLGLGMGCWTCREPVNLRSILMPLFILFAMMVPIAIFSLGNRISLMLNAYGDILLFTETVTGNPLQTILYTLLGLGFTLALLVLVWDLFLPLGRLLGRMLADYPGTNRAYSVNIAGSLVGIWLFVLLSAAQTPPWVWAAAGASLLLALGYVIGRVRSIDAALAIALVPLAHFANIEEGALEVKWSPYQKLALTPGGDPLEKYSISVNHSGGYQAMLDFSAAAVAANPERYPVSLRGINPYELPAVLHPKVEKLLILGGGSGNGTAAALRLGVPDITTVDIDPVSLDYGKRFHPEKPYDSPKVRVVCDDARAALANSTEKFDVIAYEYLDSHTGGSMTNTRLDHFVYTKESFEQAKRLLKEGGQVVVRFGYERTFIADRMKKVLKEVFGQEPFVFGVKSPFQGMDGLIMVAGDVDAVKKQVADRPALAAQVDAWNANPQFEMPGKTRIATDDWPYIYLEKPGVPLLYWLLGVVLVILFLRGAKQLPKGTFRLARNRDSWHFFLLGAAFMLLETQNVSKAAVALGSTWWVNAVIISAVLAMILLSNLIASLWPKLPMGFVFAGLIGSCVGLYFVDISAFISLPFALRALVVGAVTSLPILFSGIVFIRAFSAARDKENALGCNLMGSLCGGLLQSITFLTGIQALLLIVAALYLGAFLTLPGRRRSAVAVKEVEREAELVNV